MVRAPRSGNLNGRKARADIGLLKHIRSLNATWLLNLWVSRFPRSYVLTLVLQFDCSLAR